MHIKMYGADWCSDCINAKNFLNSRGVNFDYIIITDNPAAIAFLERVNKGKKTIPTLIVNGEVYTNPGISGLMKIVA